MSFHSINPLEKPQTYLDIAFRKASKAQIKTAKGSDVFKAKEREKEKLSIIKDDLADRLHQIISGFPNLDKMPEFYAELVKLTLDEEKFRKALVDVDWTIKKINDLYKIHRNRIRGCESAAEAGTVKKAFLGRVSSLFKQLSPALKYLSEARTVLMDFPPIKTEIPTVCIAGFPNVGKSTLLSKLTTSKPEIKNYAFTTKRLNLGYTTMESGKVQFIDSPGTLARPEKMNNIEKQAYLAIKMLATCVVFIFDPTETYPVKEQEALLEIVKSYGKPVIIYISKTDIADKKAIDNYAKKHDVTTDVDSLINEIRKNIA